MTSIFTRWFRRNFSSPATIVLTMLIIVGFFVILTVGDILAPILWALVIAYLLEWGVTALQNKGLGRLTSVLLVFTAFIGISIVIFLGLVPLIWKQGSRLIGELPNIMLKLKEQVLELPNKYPNFVSAEQVDGFITSLNSELGSLGEALLSASFSSLISIASLLVYII